MFCFCPCQDIHTLDALDELISDGESSSVGGDVGLVLLGFLHMHVSMYVICLNLVLGSKQHSNTEKVTARFGSICPSFSPVGK